MQAAPRRRTYQTLEGLRAIGAFMVVMRHVPYLFGPVKVPESFLAVDLFYLVSGFVVAHAYGERLTRGGFLADFVKTRIIRLYPLYLFGLGLGVVSALISIFGDPKGWWTWGKLAEAVGGGLFLVPMVPGLASSGSALDGPVWTLLPELIANFVYAAAIRWLRWWVLLAIMAVCGAGLVFAEQLYGTLDVGYNPTDQWAALARVGFSFFAGVLVFRLTAGRELRSTLISCLCLAGLGVALAFEPSDELAAYYEPAMILVGFPALISVAAIVEPGPRLGRLFGFLGLMSYGVYIVHQPLGNIIRSTVLRVTPPPHGWSGLVVGALFLAACVALAWGLDVAYDAPVRRRLRARFMPAATSRVAAA